MYGAPGIKPDYKRLAERRADRFPEWIEKRPALFFFVVVGAVEFAILYRVFVAVAGQ